MSWTLGLLATDRGRGTGWPDKVENPVFANLEKYLK